MCLELKKIKQQMQQSQQTLLRGERSVRRNLKGREMRNFQQIYEKSAITNHQGSVNQKQNKTWPFLSE